MAYTTTGMQSLNSEIKKKKKVEVPTAPMANSSPAPTVQDKILEITNPDREKPDPRMQGTPASLYRDIQANKKAPEGYHKAGTYASDFKKPLTLEEQWQQELDTSAAKAKWMAEHTPTPDPALNPELAAQIGQIDPNIANNPNDPVSQSIKENAAAYNRVDNLTNPLDRIAAFPSTINKVTGALGTVPIIGDVSRSVINILSTDRSAREYWNDYSNKDNYEAVKKNIGTADDQITKSINTAKQDANTPENQELAIKVYNGAMSQKYATMKQLQDIAANDQRAYTDKIRDDLIELELYFNGNPQLGIPSGKSLDDEKMFNALNRPTPKYLAGVQ